MPEAVERDLVERLKSLRAYLVNAAHGTDAFVSDIRTIDDTFAVIDKCDRTLDDNERLRERFGLLDAKLTETYAALSRAEAEREEAVNACDTRFDNGYQMGLEHSIRVCEIAKNEKLSFDAAIARIGLRAPDPTRLSRTD